MSSALTLGDRRNGNQAQTFTCNTRHRFPHDAENRLVQVSGAATASFVYDGDGKRVLAIEGGTTTVFIGNYFKWSGTPASAVRYYYAGTTRLAMRRGSGSVTWLLGDHLGSASVSYDGTSELHQGYKPWGETRFGEVGTPYQFTGQYRQASLGLDFFNARWYDPALGRFAQADTIVPGAGNPQAWDRYAYSLNSPIVYIDPTGHKFCWVGDNPDGCERDQTTDKLAAQFGIEFKDTITRGRYNRRAEEYTESKIVKWTLAQKNKVIAGVGALAAAFARVTGKRGLDVFVEKFGPLAVTLTGSSDRAVCEAGNVGFSCNGEPSARLVVHELGHVLNGRLGNAAYEAMESASIYTAGGLWVTGRTAHGLGGWVRTFSGYKKPTYDAVMHGEGWDGWELPGEEFADMLMNWAFNSFTSDRYGYGLARWEWMNGIMPFLLYPPKPLGAVQ